MQQINPIFLLLQSSGWIPLAIGVFIALLGIVVYLIGPKPKAGMVFTLLSMIPAIVGMLLVFRAFADFSQWASSPTAPKAADFARIVSRAMGSSFYALLGTIIPLCVSVLLQARSEPQPQE